MEMGGSQYANESYPRHTLKRKKKLSLYRNAVCSKIVNFLLCKRCANGENNKANLLQFNRLAFIEVRVKEACNINISTYLFGFTIRLPAFISMPQRPSLQCLNRRIENRFFFPYRKEDKQEEEQCLLGYCCLSEGDR